MTRKQHSQQYPRITFRQRSPSFQFDKHTHNNASIHICFMFRVLITGAIATNGSHNNSFKSSGILDFVYNFSSTKLLCISSLLPFEAWYHFKMQSFDARFTRFSLKTIEEHEQVSFAPE